MAILDLVSRLTTYCVDKGYYGINGQSSGVASSSEESTFNGLEDDINLHKLDIQAIGYSDLPNDKAIFIYASNVRKSNAKCFQDTSIGVPIHLSKVASIWTKPFRSTRGGGAVFLNKIKYAVVVLAVSHKHRTLQEHWGRL